MSPFWIGFLCGFPGVPIVVFVVALIACWANDYRYEQIRKKTFPENYRDGLAKK